MKTFTLFAATGLAMARSSKLPWTIKEEETSMVLDSCKVECGTDSSLDTCVAACLAKKA